MKPITLKSGPLVFEKKIMAKKRIQGAAMEVTARSRGNEKKTVKFESHPRLKQPMRTIMCQSWKTSPSENFIQTIFGTTIKAPHPMPSKCQLGVRNERTKRVKPNHRRNLGLDRAVSIRAVYRPSSSDSARERGRLQSERDGRVR